MVPKLQTKANWLEEAELEQEISIDISDDTVVVHTFCKDTFMHSLFMLSKMSL